MGAVVLLAMGQPQVAFGEHPEIARLHTLNLEDDEATAAAAAKVLERPEELTSAERLIAQAYLCEALSTLERESELAVAIGQVEATLPAEPARAEVEPYARLLACLGHASRMRGDTQAALVAFDRALLALEGLQEPITTSFVLYRRGGLFITTGNHPRAIADLEGALAALDTIPNHPNIEAQRNNIRSAMARLYLRRNEPAAAWPHLEALAAFVAELGDERSEATVLLMLANCAVDLRRDDVAKGALSRARDIGLRVDNPALVGRADVGLGRLAAATGSYDRALQLLDAGRKALTAAGSESDLLDADLERASVLHRAKLWGPLQSLVQTLDPLVARLAPDRLGTIYEHQAAAAEGLGDLAAALAWQRRASEARVRDLESQLERQVAERFVELEVAELQQRTIQLARQNEVERVRVERAHEVARLQRGVLALAAGLVLALAVLVWRGVRSRKRLAELARLDPLTGMLNRRAAIADAQAALAAPGKGLSGCVAILDVDHFKSVNDAHGHAAGDQVLRQVAACIVGNLRTTDVAGRIGGEEFLLAFPRLDGPAAHEALERLRLAIAALVPSTNDRTFDITASIGLAICNPTETLDSALHRADGALYEAKRAGRNRLVEARRAPRDGE